MFESKSQPMISRRRFAGRMLRSFSITLAIALVSLVIGTIGYCYFGRLEALDGLLNASMILTGMGPVDPMRTDGGKLFASLYALYSGIAFLSITAVITAPIFHRILHRFHLEEDESVKDRQDQEEQQDSRHSDRETSPKSRRRK